MSTHCESTRYGKEAGVRKVANEYKVDLCSWPGDESPQPGLLDHADLPSRRDGLHLIGSD